MELPLSAEKLFSWNILTALFFFSQVSTSRFTDRSFPEYISKLVFTCATLKGEPDFQV